MVNIRVNGVPIEAAVSVIVNVAVKLKISLSQIEVDWQETGEFHRLQE